MVNIDVSVLENWECIIRIQLLEGEHLPAENYPPTPKITPLNSPEPWIHIIYLMKALLTFLLLVFITVSIPASTLAKPQIKYWQKLMYL
jgi:hypothetical protein